MLVDVLANVTATSVNDNMYDDDDDGDDVDDDDDEVVMFLSIMQVIVSVSNYNTDFEL